MTKNKLIFDQNNDNEQYVNNNLMDNLLKRVENGHFDYETADLNSDNDKIGIDKPCKRHMCKIS